MPTKNKALFAIGMNTAKRERKRPLTCKQVKCPLLPSGKISCDDKSLICHPDYEGEIES